MFDVSSASSTLFFSLKTKGSYRSHTLLSIRQVHDRAPCYSLPSHLMAVATVLISWKLHSVDWLSLLKLPFCLPTLCSPAWGSAVLSGYLTTSCTTPGLASCLWQSIVGVLVFNETDSEPYDAIPASEWVRLWEWIRFVLVAIKEDVLQYIPFLWYTNCPP